MRHELAAVRVEWVALSPESARKAERRVSACQACSPSVLRPFSSVLIEALGAAGPVGQYLLAAPAHCPNCEEPIFEDTLVRSEGEAHTDGGFCGLDLGECPDDGHVMLVDEPLLEEAQAWISGCEHCRPAVGVPFDYVLDALTESDPTRTEYVLCRAARCPRCRHAVTERTLVVASGGFDGFVC